MAKPRTTWRRQGNTANDPSYQDPTIDYDDPNTPFASSQTTESVIKKRNAWTKQAKPRSVFVINAAAFINRLIFNSHNLYNSHLTYDSITVGEAGSTTKKPAIWSKL